MIEVGVYCSLSISTYVNESRDTRDLEQVYGRMITESDDSKVWKSGDCPEALGDSPHAQELKPDNNCSTSDDECSIHKISIAYRLR